MSDRTAEVLSAFLDGEPVETSELTEALATPDARETMIDYILMRATIVEGGERPSREFYARMESRLHPARTLPGRRWLSIAAAAAVVVALTGIWLGRQVLIPTPATAVIEMTAPDRNPPEPSRVLHLERGVDWHGQG